MSRLEMACWAGIVICVAAIFIPAIADRKAHPERLQQIEDCIKSGGIAVVSHTWNGDYIRRVQCAKGRK